LHLVLNPDVELAPDALRQALSFLRAHPEVNLLTPAVFAATGERQYLCRRYPSLLDFGLRGFAPAWLKRRFSARLARLELRAECANQVYWNPPLVSGCFMLVRRTAILQTGGFSPVFPLYFEDYDWSLRLAQTGRIAYVPQVHIVHHGGGAARKGWRHLGLFLYSAGQFYRRHGWRLW
jgi:GT2 family glycosyltransferase